jgi:hypothetical protein
MLHGRGAFVIMDRHTKPDGDPTQGKPHIVGSGNSTASENVNIGDSGERTQDANRFAAVNSAQPEGGTEHMPSAKEITRAVFSSWVERRLRILKEWREQSQNTADDRETSPATPLTSKERHQERRINRRER